MIFAWDKRGEIFAFFGENNHVYVYDTTSNDMIHDLVLPIKIQTSYSSVSFSEEKRQNNKKKDKIANFLACGTKTGKIILWDIKKGEFVKEISTGQNETVFVEFLDQNTLIFTTPNFAATCTIDKGESSIKKLDHGKSNITSLKVIKEKYIMIGTRGIVQVFEFSTKQKLFSLQANDVKLFGFSEEYILTCSNDNFLNLFKIDKSSKLSPIQVISVQDDIHSLDMIKMEDTLDIVTVTNKGLCQVWKISNIGEKGSKPVSTITRKNGLILSAIFRDSNAVFTCSGSFLHPTFENTLYISDDNVIEKIIINKDVKKDNQTQTNGEEGTILGLVNMETESARFTQAIGEKKKDFSKKVIDIDVDSLLETKEKKVPKVSMVSTLSHALQHKDDTVIVKCLLQDNVELIHETVSQLHHELSTTLLENVIDKYQNGIISNTCLVNWIKNILLSHASYIMSNSDLLNKLSPLYHTINARITTYQSLLDLSGRLDFVLGLSGNKMIGLKVENDLVEDDEQGIKEDMDEIKTEEDTFEE